ncbi:hypothetical protein D3C87_1430930 [compost metagenome]
MVRTGTESPEFERALYADRELNLSWYREGQETAEAIEDMASIPSAAARDIQAILEDRHDDVEMARMGAETEFAADACYEEKKTDAREWHWAWSSFELALQTEARFFNREGSALLAPRLWRHRSVANETKASGDRFFGAAAPDQPPLPCTRFPVGRQAGRGSVPARFAHRRPTRQAVQRRTDER